MKKLFFAVAVLFFGIAGFSQDMTKFKLYNPEANAKKEIAEAVKQAKVSDKHVLIQVGGNWCIWCARFNDFVTNQQRPQRQAVTDDGIRGGSAIPGKCCEQVTR